MQLSFEQSSADSLPAFLHSSSSSSAAAEEAECRWRERALDAGVSQSVMWGPQLDPVDCLRLSAVWPFFPYSELQDGDEALDPLQAPEWRLAVSWRAAEEAEAADSSGRREPGTASLYAEALCGLLAMRDSLQAVHALSDVLGSAADATTAAHSLSLQAAAAGSTGSGVSSASSPSSSSSPGPSSALTAIKAVQSSLAAHIESANLSALYGELPAAERLDAAMRAVFDISPDEQQSESRAQHSAAAAAAASSSSSSLSSSLDPARPLCPVGSLLSLFASELCCLHRTGSLSARALAAYWREFVNESRFHFESGLRLPHLDMEADAQPDYNACLLHQKLQLLQRCIAVQRLRAEWQTTRQQGREKEREGQQALLSAASSSVAVSSSTAGSEEELTDGWQQFDFAGRTRRQQAARAARARTRARTARRRPTARSDCGRRRRSGHRSARCISSETSACCCRTAGHSSGAVRLCSALPGRPQLTSLLLLVCASVLTVSVDRPLLVPVSQPSAALTADQLEAEAELLLRLGDDAAAEALRRERAEAALQSDMAAFKAANPGAVLEDFVRWHSPKDWRSRAGDGDSAAAAAAAQHSVPSRRRDRRRGELSLRMRQKSNAWQRLWTVSSRQTARGGSGRS